MSDDKNSTEWITFGGELKTVHSPTVSELHREAMAFAEKAFIAKHRGDTDTALENFRLAYPLEIQAAQMVNTQPNHSVLYRSAGNLALDAGEIDLALKLAHEGLVGNPPPEIAHELNVLIERVNDAMVKRHMKAGE